MFCWAKLNQRGIISLFFWVQEKFLYFHSDFVVDRWHVDSRGNGFLTHTLLVKQNLKDVGHSGQSNHVLAVDLSIKYPDFLFHEVWWLHGYYCLHCHYAYMMIKHRIPFFLSFLLSLFSSFIQRRLSFTAYINHKIAQQKPLTTYLDKLWRQLVGYLQFKIILCFQKRILANIFSVPTSFLTSYPSHP